MRPSFLDEMSWAMAEVYGAVTDRILVNLAKYFPYIRDGEEPRGGFEYQTRMLAQMGQVNRETVDIIAQSLGGADEALRQALEAAILDALKTEEPKLRKAAEQGLLNGPGLLPPEIDPAQMRTFEQFYKQSADKLNLVNTAMLESTQEAYRATVADVEQRIQRTQSILNVAAGETVTGVSTYNQAMHDAVRKMVANGLTGFVDHGGHRWTPEAYVAMDIRTTMFNTARSAINEEGERFGCDFYQVSTHRGARPLCYPWQGKVISRSGWTGTVEDLDGNTVQVHSESEIESFRYGGGLFGVNCGHYPMNFIPGVSTIKGEPQDPEENEKTYAESQQQRALERKLREERRELAVMKAQGADEQDIKAQRAKVKQASADIDQFCEDTGRARRRNREYTPVNAKFPPKGSYDPKEFPHDERDRINDWFKNGGDNPPPRPTNIHLGPDNIPPQGQAQIPIDAGNDTATIPPSDAYKSGNTHDGNGDGKKSYYKSFKGVDDVPDDQAEIVNARFRELDKKYHARVEHIGTTLGEEQRRYDIQLENRIQYEMEQNPRMRRKTAEKKAIELLGERPSAHGKGWLERTTLGGEYWPESPMYGNESLLTLNPNSLYDARDISEDIAKRKRRIERNTIRISEGKKPLKFSNVSGSFEGTFIHEYGHAVDFTYGIAENDVFKAFYSSLTDEQRAISTYALTNEREFIAEAFAESFMGETQGEVSKQFMKIMEGIVSGKP